MKNILQQKLAYLFPTALLQELSEVGKLAHYTKNDIIMDVNQELHSVPLVISGSVKVLREDINGNELLLYFLEEGDTCAMSLTCCLKHSKSKIRAIADIDSEILFIPAEKMNEWFETEPSWRNFILESYQIRFNEMLETIDTLAFLKMDERLHKYIIDKIKVQGHTLLHITHQEIAEDLNTSRVVVSRLLKQLENQNLIKLFRNKIEVLKF
ncbi:MULTISPECIES: Crp/Fnr family transcriptional regulator [Galbibacter]|uniref:cAMP-binding protein n=1 Tax=Galbibacter orientalis DSM 19592 TaxID=926559 RepID=I3C7Q6_9FLAO|nr:Crp/Fnr family transcriptional regulator [Galbibacter orientalis]EIJ39649.1 cAMP-binding protein [Galbibacter orientalis DSM 19592]